jgi:hypothetical protein
MALTKVSFSMIEGAYANVLDFGAVGDGLTDDSAAIQAAVNASDCVYFPPGKTYMAVLIYIRPGMTIIGYGATIKLLPNQGKFARLLTTQNNLLNQVDDSEPLNVVGLRFDGNRTNQGPYLGYEKEQQMLLFLDAGNNNTGRLVANVSDCDFVESCSDGIGVYINVDVAISNCHFWNCFRGSITPIGGFSKIKFTNVSAGGNVHNSFLNIEPDGGGGGVGDLSLDICGSNSVFEGTLDCGMTYGGTALFDNCKFKGIGFDIVGSNSANLLNFRAVNCEFTVQEATNSYLQWPNFAQFDNCKFNHSENSAAIPALYVIWGANTNQRIVFNGCQHVHKGPGAFATLAAVYVAATSSPTNVIEFDGGSIGDGSALGDTFTYGVYLSQGGAFKMDNTVVHADYIGLASSTTGFSYSVHLGQVTLGANNVGFMFLNSSSSGNILRFDNTVIPSGKNTIGSFAGWGSGFTVIGGRVVFGSSAPTGTDVAFIGDHYRLTTPVAGSAYEYVATNTSYTAAVWKTSATLAA